MGMEEKSKRLFFVQIMEDFFDDEDIVGMRELAGDHFYEYVYIYLQMILKSLATDGYLRKDSLSKYTPQTLRRRINFQTNNGFENDWKVVDQAVVDFESLGLLFIQKDGTIYMKKVQAMSMNKSEYENKRLGWRKKTELYQSEYQETEEPEEAEKDKLFCELFSLLICSGYAAKTEYYVYTKIFTEILERSPDKDQDHLLHVFNVFIKRTDWRHGKIIDRKHYLVEAIINMIQNPMFCPWLQEDDEDE